MKGGREHRVPLGPRALDIVDEMRAQQQGDKNGSVEPVSIIFPGVEGGELSDMSLTAVLRRMGRDDITVHGFRSTFRDWAAERTSFQSEVAEMALAHVVGNKVEAAYRRGDLFEKRRRLMEAWESFASSPSATASVVVVPLRKDRVS
jgi:integrase